MLKREKIVILTLAVLILAVPIQWTQAATALELQQELLRKQRELDANQSAAQNKAAEAKTITNQIDGLNSDIQTTESKIVQTGSQISDVSSQIESLNKDIDQKIKDLADLKKKLNSAMVEIYRFSSRSNFDLLFSGQSLGATTNESNYVAAVEIQVKNLHTQVDLVKKDLEKQKSDSVARQNELTDLKSRQVAYKSGVEYQKTQKDKLLGMTLQQKDEYEAKAKKIQSEISVISAEIYKLRQTRKGRGIVSGGGSAYSPSSGRNDVDAWGFVPYQCTSYAAWYWNVKLGKPWDNTRPGSGSAYNWDNLATDQGYSVSSTPRVGAIISWEKGLYAGDQWGHVAIVEKVNGDGTIDVSEYNFAYREAYSYRTGINPADEGVGFSYVY